MKVATINGKAYAVCRDCGSIVRFDKPLLGSLHICTLPEERQTNAQEIARRVAASEKLIGEG